MKRLYITALLSIILLLFSSQLTFAQEVDDMESQEGLELTVIPVAPEGADATELTVSMDFAGIAERAEELYKSGEYEEALASYTSILDGGESSSALYYNIGNCYYRLGETTQAIIFYERAKRLAPGDAAINYNLEMARRETVDKIEELPSIFFVRWYREFVNGISVDRWAYISVALFILFLVMAALFLFSRVASIKRVGFFVGLIAILLTIWSIVIAHSRYNAECNEVQAIVITPSVTVKGSPDNSGTDLFLIHEGLKVDVVSTLGDWCNIRLVDGNEGWISLSDIEKI